MSIAVIDYMAEEKLMSDEGKQTREFIENIILRNLDGKNEKVLFFITDDHAILMPQQHMADKKIDARIVKQAFYIARKYGICSKMSFSNPHGGMLCEFW